MSIGKLIAYTLRRFFDFGHEQRIPCPYFQSYETTDLTIKKMTKLGTIEHTPVFLVLEII